MATESFMSLWRNGPKTVIAVINSDGVYNVGVQSEKDENCHVIVPLIAKSYRYLSSIYSP